MFKSKIVAAALAFALASGMAHAVNVVDTGTPSNDPAYEWQLSQSQFFAGEFSLLGDGVINSIEGYFSTAPGVVGISVYSDGGNLPGSLLYSTNLTTSTGPLAWRGVSDLNWSLVAGDYWVAFSPDYSATLYPAPAMQGGAPNPLAAYAQNQGAGWGEPGENLALGVRIDATVAAPVPEPSSLLLYGVGIIALSVMGRRRLNAG